MDFLTVYDIADPKRLGRVATAMKRYGVRVQKSVFECSLSESGVQAMRRSVEQEMELTEDSVRIYPLLADSRRKQTILGVGSVSELPAALVF